MILQAGGPPDTSAYYHTAYVWVAVVYVGYSVSLWMRERRIRQRHEKTAGAESPSPRSAG